MDPSDDTHISGPSQDAIEPINAFCFDDHSAFDQATTVPGHGSLDDLGFPETFQWQSIPFDIEPQPQAFDDLRPDFTIYQTDPSAYNRDALPTITERQFFDVEDFSPLSQQTSNENLTPPDPKHRRRSIRKRRIENGYHCTEPFCEEAFDTAGELTKHRLRKHTLESSWPFACEICGKRFYDKRDHGRHMNVERKRESLRAIVREPPPSTPINRDTENDREPDSYATPSSSIKPSRSKAEPEEVPPKVEKTGSRDFTRANDQHASIEELLEAATADLTRFVHLGADHITIKAAISSNGDEMTFGVAHAVMNDRQQGAEVLPATTPSPQREASKPDCTDMTAVMSPASALVPQHLGRASPSVALKAQPVSQAKAITVTFRSRPSFHRSITSPPALSMVRVGCC